MPHEQTHPIPSYDVIFTCRIKSADFKDTVKIFSRVMAEEAAKVMGEFGFCPTWGFIQPEPLEDLGQHLSWLFFHNLSDVFSRRVFFSMDAARGGAGGGEGRPGDLSEVWEKYPSILKIIFAWKKEEEEIPKSLKV